MRGVACPPRSPPRPRPRLTSFGVKSSASFIRSLWKQKRFWWLEFQHGVKLFRISHGFSRERVRTRCVATIAAMKSTAATSNSCDESIETILLKVTHIMYTYIHTYMKVKQTIKKFSSLKSALAGCLTSNRRRDVEVRINPLKTKRRLLYLNTQFVPRCKHFSSRL